MFGGNDAHILFVGIISVFGTPQKHSVNVFTCCRCFTITTRLSPYITNAMMTFNVNLLQYKSIDKVHCFLTTFCKKHVHLNHIKCSDHFQLIFTQILRSHSHVFCINRTLLTAVTVNVLIA